MRPFSALLVRRCRSLIRSRWSRRLCQVRGSWWRRSIAWPFARGGSSMPEVTMPRLSDTMQEGTIARWLKKPGDRVERGDVLAEIETDKATMELQAYESGVLEKILIQEGESAPIGQVIALIGSGAAVADQEEARAVRPAPQTTTASSATG